MKEIRFSGRTPSPEELTIGMETDSNAETLRFYLPEIADGQIATLQMILPDGVPEAIEIINGEVLIPARIMEAQGTARAWVEILAGDVMAWHSEMILLGIHALPEISDRTEQEYPTAFQDAIALTLGNRQAAETAANAAEIAAAIAKSAQGNVTVEINGDGDLIVTYEDTEGETTEANLGPVSAYTVAKKYGFPGTEQEWEEAIASVGEKADAAAQSAEDAAASAEEAQTANTAAQAAKTAAQTAQEAAETAAERDTAAWLEENITNPDSPPLDRTLSFNTAAAPADMVGDLKSALQATTGCVDGIEIERYTKTHDEISGTIKNGYMYDRRGYETQINKWAYLTVSAQPNHAYLISGTASTNARLYTILDANGNVIDLADSDSTVRKENVKCITPGNAATLIVNANTNQGDPSVKDATNKYTYDGEPLSPIAVETSPNIYTIDGGDYETVVQLYGTPNGTVKMDTLNRSGSAFKSLTDDVTPVNFDAANYVGANHGYEFGVKMTITGHGLTTANIGSVYSDTSTGYEWVLLYIVDTNNVMTCALSSNRWYGMANVPVASMPSTVNFGTGILTVSSTEKTAIFPSVKNIDISVAKNNAEHFVISETYDIIDPSVGLAWIQNNVGSCGNTSFALHSNSLVTVRNLYNFDASGNCVISQNLITVKSAELDFYGGVQSMRFSTSDRFAVIGTTYNKLTTAPSSGGIYFDRDNTWDDESVPPICYIQSDGDVSGYTKLFISIIMMNGRNALLKTNAGFYQSTHKMYPYVIEIDDTVAARTGYGMTSVRVPVYAGSDAYCFRTFKANGRDYGFFAKRASGLVHITMPEELRGKNVTVLARSNCRILADTVVNVFDIYATDEAYMLMEFD